MDSLDCTVLKTSKYKITVATDNTRNIRTYFLSQYCDTTLKIHTTGIREMLQIQPLLGNAKHRSPVATDVHMYCEGNCLLISL
jgi:hypothetical protein